MSDANEKSDEEKTYMVCMRVAEGASVVENSEVVQCSRCNEDVHIAQSSLKILKARNGHVVCIQCAFETMKNEKKAEEKNFLVHPHQLQEMASQLVRYHVHDLFAHPN